jgi:hypothetical protein
MEDFLTFGVTLDQLDELNSLIRRITANGDVIAVCGANLLDRQSLPALGEAIYDAACGVRSILAQIHEQRVENSASSK